MGLKGYGEGHSEHNQIDNNNSFVQICASRPAAQAA
jgi:hypothetical protein